MIYREFNTKLNFAFAVLSLGLCVFVSVQSLARMPVTLSVSHVDKILHMLAYFVLGFFVFPALYKVRPWVVWALLCVCGIMIEGLQGVMNLGRTADFLDVVANASGALLAGLLWLCISLVVIRLKNRFSP